MKMNIGGKVTFSMIGAYCEDMINDLIADKVGLENIRSVDNVLYAETGAANYSYIADRSRQYGVRVRVTSKKGAYFRLAGFRKRPGLVLGIFVSAIMVFTLRLFVWHRFILIANQLSNEKVIAHL